MYAHVLTFRPLFFDWPFTQDAFPVRITELLSSYGVESYRYERRFRDEPRRMNIHTFGGPEEVFLQVN